METGDLILELAKRSAEYAGDIFADDLGYCTQRELCNDVLRAKKFLDKVAKECKDYVLWYEKNSECGRTGR